MLNPWSHGYAKVILTDFIVRSPWRGCDLKQTNKETTLGEQKKNIQINKHSPGKINIENIKKIS